MVMYFHRFGHSLTIVQAWLISIDSIEMTSKSEMILAAIAGAYPLVGIWLKS